MTASLIFEAIAWIVPLVSTGIGCAVVLLLRWQRHAGQRIAVLEAANRSERLEEAERAVAAVRLEMARDYIARVDWVPMTSRVVSMLEDHSRLLARLDERTRARAAGEEDA